MTSEQYDKDWKLKLRYGKFATPYRHYTAIAEGVAGELTDGFSCPPGDAFMSMKTWASSTDECSAMAEAIGRQIGFAVTRAVQIYDTEPDVPPRDQPFAYDIGFYPFAGDKSQASEP